jgi:hypothetical protein
MTVRTQRKRFLAAADFLRSTKKLTRNQRLYLALAFERIGHGMSADEAFGLKYTVGRSKVNEVAREELALIFHWVRGSIEPLPGGGPGLTVSQALDAVFEISNFGIWVDPLTGVTHKYIDKHGAVRSPFRPYSRESLSKAWYDSKNQYLKRLDVGPLDQDSPYDFVRRPSR